MIKSTFSAFYSACLNNLATRVFLIKRGKVYSKHNLYEFYKYKSYIKYDENDSIFI